MEDIFNQIHRGEVYYYGYYSSFGSEQAASNGRPCVIVSNEKCNEHSTIVSIVPLTSKDKKPLPTHVYFDIGSVYGTALCEQVTTISKDRLLTYVGEVSDDTLKSIDKALAVQLALVDIDYSPVPYAETYKAAKDTEIKNEKPVPAAAHGGEEKDFRKAAARDVLRMVKSMSNGGSFDEYSKGWDNAVDTIYDIIRKKYGLEVLNE